MDREVIEQKLESLRHCLQRIETIRLARTGWRVDAGVGKQLEKGRGF